MNKLLRSFSALALLLLLVLSMLSCGEVKIVCDEGEILAAAENLIGRSVLWNEIFYIEGMRPLEGGRAPSDSYVEVDPAYLDEIGFSTVAEIKAYGKEIFSPDMMRSFEDTLFGGMKSDIGAIVSSAACMDYEEPVTGVKLYPVVNPAESPKRYGETPWGEHIEYIYSTMRVTYNLNYSATVELEIVGAEEKNLGMRDTLSVQLKKVEGVWYLDNLTVAKIDR